jgi:hypothetical protein
MPPGGAALNPHELPTTQLEVAPSPPGTPAAPGAIPAGPSAPPAPSLAEAPAAPATPVQTSMVAASGEQCPNCNANMAADQRYCLECGQRRGDPRLPFMDAVVFMDAVKRPRDAAPPPPPRERKPRISANASLIAGIATLVLAIGVGVLIGRSGESGTSSAGTAPPVQVVKVGGGTETESATPKEANSAGSKGKGGSGKSKKAKAKAKSETGSSGTSKAVEEVLKPEAGVKLPPPTTQVGGKCEKGTAGCSSSGEFNGNFFGE